MCADKSDLFVGVFEVRENVYIAIYVVVVVKIQVSPHFILDWWWVIFGYDPCQISESSQSLVHPSSVSPFLEEIS